MKAVFRHRLEHGLRSLHAGVAVLFPALLAVLLGVMVALLTANRRRGLNVLTPFLGQFGAWIAGMHIDLQPAAGLRLRQPAIIIFNHQSGLDPIILCRVVGRNVIGIAKRELKCNPVLGPLLWFAETIFVDRFDQQQKQAAVQPALDALARGLSIAIAPEGKRQSAQPLGSFRSGPFRLAVSAGVPVVPVVIHDSAQLLAPRCTDLYPGTVHVDVLPAIDTASWRDKPPAELADYVHAQMLERLCIGPSR